MLEVNELVKSAELTELTEQSPKLILGIVLEQVLAQFKAEVLQLAIRFDFAATVVVPELVARLVRVPQQVEQYGHYFDYL